MNPGTASNVAARVFLLIPYHGIKSCCTNTDRSTIPWKGQKTAEISSLLLKPTPNLEPLVNQFNNATPENNTETENNFSSKYYDFDEMHNVAIPNKNKFLSLFHKNTCSLNKNFDDLQHFLSCTKNNFDIIGVTETRITNQVSLLNNMNLSKYSYEFTPTETTAGGTLLYNANHLSHKCRNDLNIYKKNELESTFIEIVDLKDSNIIVRVICRHPSMDLTDFNSSYLNYYKILQKKKDLSSCPTFSC